MAGPDEGTGRDDDRLLAELGRAAARHDPVPAKVLTAARGSLAWLDVDVELAALAYDSLTDERALTAVRGDGPRLLRFAGSELTIEMEVSSEGDTRRLVGQVLPETTARLEISYPGGRQEVLADDRGHFRASGVPAGAVRLTCAVERGGRSVATHTDWTLL